MKPNKLLVFSLILSFGLFLSACAWNVETIPTTVTTASTTESTSESTTTSVTTTTTISEVPTTESTTSTETTTTTTTDNEEEIAQAILLTASRRVLITNADRIETDFSLPSTVGDTIVTWSADLPLILGISASPMLELEGFDYYVVNVNRPSDADVTVILTGHFQYGDYVYDAQYTIRVKLETGLTVYPTISALHGTAVLTDYVQVTGYVYSIYKYGYFLIDASGVALNVYTTLDNVALVAIGDEVVVKGTYANYHTLNQVITLTKQTVLSHDNAVNVTPTILDDPTALMALDATNKALHGQLFTLTATLKEVVGTQTNLYLYAGETQLAVVYYNSEVASLEALRTFLNQEITLNVLYYTLHSGPLVYVTFFGGMGDIIATPLSDEQKLAIDVENLVLPNIASAGEDLELPGTGLHGTTITWVSGNPTLAPIVGNLVSFDAGIVSETITLTATISYGSLTPVEKAIDILVYGHLDLATINGMPNEVVVTATGNVYLILQNGYFISDPTGNLAVYTGGVPTVALGDSVTVTGPLSSYGTLKQLYIPTATIIDANGNREIPESALFESTAGLESGNLYQITGTLKREGAYNNFYLYDGSTKIGVIYYKSPADALTSLESLVNTVVTLEVYYYSTTADTNSGGAVTAFFAFDNFTATLTDDEKAERDVARIAIDPIGFLGKSVIFPQDGYYGSLFSYACDNTEAVSIYSVAGLVYGVKADYLALGSITITATATIGEATATKDFTVDIQTLTLTAIGDIAIGMDGTLVYVEGVVIGFHGNEGFFLQNSAGIGIYVDGWLDGIVLGNTITLRAEVDSIAGLVEDFVFLSGTDLWLIANDYSFTAAVGPLFDGTSLVGFSTFANLVGSFVSIDDLMISKYENGYIWFFVETIESTDIYLKVAYTDLWIPTAYPAGFVIPHAELIVFRQDGAEIIGVNLALPELTDAQKLDLDLALVEDPMTITDELILPVLTYGTYSDIVISAELTAYVTFADGIFDITRPASGSGNAVGTLSFLLTVGTVSTTVEIALTVEAESSAAFADLFISEYIEGSSYNKYIEIYNGTGVAVDLSAYTLTLYSNGSTTATATLTLSGILNPGQVLIVYNSQGTLVFSNPNGVTLTSNTVINYNGDDAIVLRHNGEVIDAIGKVGERPSIGYWGDATVSTQNRTLVRKPSITSGRTDPSTTFDPNAEWIAYAVDTATYLGSHVIN